MKATALSKNYGYLTGEERYRLITAALEEQNKLRKTAKRIQLAAVDYAPYEIAFAELSVHRFLEVLEIAANFDAVLTSLLTFGDMGGCADDEIVAKNHDESGGESTPGDATSIGYVDAAMAWAFLLRINMESWQRFCKGLNRLPFKSWENLPGFKRLKSALAQSEGLAFGEDQFLRLINSERGRQQLPVAGLVWQLRPRAASRQSVLHLGRLCQLRQLPASSQGPCFVLFAGHHMGQGAPCPDAQGFHGKS